MSDARFSSLCSTTASLTENSDADEWYLDKTGRYLRPFTTPITISFIATETVSYEEGGKTRAQFFLAVDILRFHSKNRCVEFQLVLFLPTTNETFYEKPSRRFERMNDIR